MSWTKPFVEYYTDKNGETIAIFGQHLPGFKIETWEMHKETLERQIALYKEDEEDCSILETALINWPIEENENESA